MGVRFARAPLAPQNIRIVCYSFLLWEGHFFGGPWVCTVAKKMQDLKFQNVGYVYPVTRPWKHNCKCELMAMIFTSNDIILEVVTRYSGTHLLLFHFVKYTWNKGLGFRV